MVWNDHDNITYHKQLWIVMTYYEQLWIIMTYHERLWNIIMTCCDQLWMMSYLYHDKLWFMITNMNCYDLSWTCMNCYELFWTVMNRQYSLSIMEKSVLQVAMNELNSSRLFTKIIYAIWANAKNVMPKIIPNEARGLSIAIIEMARVIILLLNRSSLVNLMVAANKINDMVKP